MKALFLLASFGLIGCTTSRIEQIKSDAYAQGKHEQQLADIDHIEALEGAVKSLRSALQQCNKKLNLYENGDRKRR